jgi:glycosyltransferase involved in cell wall biosynthesis
VRIVLDLQACQTADSRTRGRGRYSMALAKAMARQSGAHDIWLALNGRFPDTIEPIRREFRDLIPRERVAVFEMPAGIAGRDPKNAWRMRAAEALHDHFLARLRPDVVHVSSLFEGFAEDAVAATGSQDFTNAVTLYDLIPLVRSDVYLTDDAMRGWYFRKVQHLKKADLLLAISNSSRQEAIDALGLREDTVVTIFGGPGPAFVVDVIPEARAKTLRGQYGLDRPFLMYTGGIDFRKNIEGLIDAYGQLPAPMRASHQLAIVCAVNAGDRERLLSHAERSGLSGQDVVLTGFVPDEDLAALYRLCHLFVFPSLHEGFGMPVLEAMASGAPAIGSDASSIREIIDRDDALFDASRPSAIAAAMACHLADDARRNALREHGLKRAQTFSWDDSARRALAALAHHHERRERVRRAALSTTGARKRLAYV